MHDSWTTADMPRQQGRLAVVTGATGGIGYVTALELARAGAEVVVTGRDAGRTRNAAERMAAALPGARVRPGLLDLADLASVTGFAHRMEHGGRPVDLLINNAGVMGVPERRTTKDGFELTFGTDHLGHFALTGRLLPLLLRAPDPRVVTVSAAICRSPIAELSDPQSTRKYHPMAAYAKSKLANVLFTLELQRRADAAGAALTGVAVHPGSSPTGLQRYASRPVRALARLTLGHIVGQSVTEAAGPSLYAATAPGVVPAAFYGPTGRFEQRGAPGPVELPTLAGDPALARTLWETSETLTRVRYPWPSPPA
ncbi:oxidoreductase [Streptomyces griseocarneus]|uniref:oxidoreductase n=1 Tax=Streptomyces griseocarneus TaxID=51201 RepID=UPI001995F886|nr:oxidoreductase [Streptomyces griseocarneus]MBZ6474221.1 SDR family NAD(P)-dependent oxidoreductase [Streptomyces griseocarneus]GHG52688.1 oxidoreductase [Streptomyces griseocarneus]